MLIQSQYYFIEYKNNTGVSQANDGVIITVLDKDFHIQLLDNNPGTSAGYKDAPLAGGKTFRDDTAGITVKTLAKGGSGADAWMEVKVTFDDPNSTEIPVEISFNTPSDGQNFAEGTDIPIALNVGQFPSGSVVKLEIEGNAIKKIIPSPYTHIISGLAAGSYQLKVTVESGGIFVNELLSYDIITINVGNTLSNEGFELTNAFKVYPNPVKDVISIHMNSFQEITSVSIFDAVGRSVKKIHSNGTNKMSFNISELSGGIYILQVSNGQRNYSKKIVIQ